MRRWISERNVGGVKIFTRNVSTAEALARDVREMQRLALADRFGIPLLVATDQEGGWVQHISAGAADSPGNMARGGLRHTARRLPHRLLRGRASCALSAST